MVSTLAVCPFVDRALQQAAAAGVAAPAQPAVVNPQNADRAAASVQQAGHPTVQAEATAAQPGPSQQPDTAATTAAAAGGPVGAAAASQQLPTRQGPGRSSLILPLPTHFHPTHFQHHLQSHS
jgi:hypothetical protein